MITFPNAKINLGLNVIEKRKDGYHNLETIFYPINLQDALEVTVAKEEERPYIFTNSGNVIDGNIEDNLIIKAYNIVKEHYPYIPPLRITIFKHIPSGAGLGGGSSDAAFMIKLLNKKFSLNMSDEEMENHVSRLGADCAFFIKNKPVFATGIGNIFEEIDFSLKGYYMLLIKPETFVSTKEAYANIRPRKRDVSLKELIKEPIENWRNCIENDFENGVFINHPEILDIKNKLYDIGAKYSSMSGSGSAVYGIFDKQIENVDDIFVNCFCRLREFE